MMVQKLVVQAKVIGLGEERQIIAKESGKPYTFTNVECEVADESITYEVGSWNLGKIEVGRRYEFEVDVKDNPNFLPSISKVTLNNSNGTVEAKPPQPNVTPKTSEKPQPVTQAKSQSPLKLDFGSRFREISTHQRTASMQATARVEIYKDLIVANKLVDDNGEPIVAIKKSTVEAWYSEEYDRYWYELEVRPPQDVFGDLSESSNG
jgi:hypothetical protein